MPGPSHHFRANAATKNYPDDYLNAVACPSAAQCWAVGQTGNAPGGNTLSEARHPLLQHETGGRWRRVRPAGAAGQGRRARVHRVSRVPRTAGPSAATRPGAWRSSSTGPAARGSPVASPAAAAASSNSVSCASASACWATGGTQSRSGTTADLLEHWNGSRWGIVTTVAGGLRPQHFSCPHTGYCLVLGVRDGAAAAEAYSGGRWTAIPPPPGPAGRDRRAGAVTVRLRRPRPVPGRVLRRQAWSPTPGTAGPGQP